MLLAIAFSCTGSSQNSNLNLLNTLQRSYINPAFHPDAKWSIGLGGFLADFGSSSASISDVFAKSADGTYFINNTSLLDHLSDKNTLKIDLEINTLDFAVRWKGLTVSAGHSLKLNSYVGYTKDAISLFVNGNAPYIGQTLDLSTQINLQSYNQIYLGLAYEIGKLSIGGKVKYANGVQHLSTQKGNLHFTTDEEIYQIHLDSDIELYSSGVLNYDDIRNANMDFNKYSFNNFLTKNNGLLFDVGVNIGLTDKLDVYASAIDLGSINWNFLTFQYDSHKNQVFNGIDLADYLTEKPEENGISLADTLYGLLDLEKTDTDFKTKVGADYYLGASYKYNDKLKLSALYSNLSAGDIYASALSLQGLYKLSSIIDLGVSYNLRDKRFTNLGVLGELRLGPVHMFCSTDNVFSLLGYQKFKTANGRVGLSLAFGKVKKDLEE